MTDLSLKKSIRRAGLLAIVTVVYNLAEGMVSVWFGTQDETLTLLGFGADSFVETISALGVAHMIYRIHRHPTSLHGQFETLGLRITGWCFYVLTAILILSAAFTVVRGHTPISTVSGVIIALISILSMWILIRVKIRTGMQLNSAAIIADARCNQVCLYMSLVLLAASGLWWWLRIPYVDALGTAALAWFSFSEGREAFEKVNR